MLKNDAVGFSREKGFFLDPKLTSTLTSEERGEVHRPRRFNYSSLFKHAPRPMKDEDVITALATIKVLEESPTFWCVDMSGSISSSDLEKAVQIVSSGWRDGDRLIAFDAEAAMFFTKESSLYALRNWNDGSRKIGGTNAAKCIDVANSDCFVSGRTVLLSDGLISEEHLSLFDEFIDITK